MITIEKLQKSELRKNALIKREKLAITGAISSLSSKIVSKILNSDEFKNAKNIALYKAFRNEVDISSIVNVKNKNFYFPTCTGKDMEFYKFNGEFKLGKFNILEATGERIEPSNLDIIYIPALMANRYGYRLGYGMGFYDRFFAKYKPRAKKIIVVPNELISENFIQDKFDYKCDLVLSELS